MVSPSTPDSGDMRGENQATPSSYVVRSERERLREAMLRVAARQGYEATTAAAVADAAGLPLASFEAHFVDKEECFLDAYDAVFDVLIAHVGGAFEAAAGDPWPDRVTAGLRALVQLLAQESEIARLSMVEVTSAGNRARDRYRLALDRFRPLLEEGREYSGQGESLPPDTARFAIGGAAAMLFDEIRAGRGPMLEGILPALVFSVLMPYLGPRGAEVEMRRVAAGAS